MKPFPSRSLAHILVGVIALLALLQGLYILVGYQLVDAPWLRLVAETWNMDAEVSLPTWYAQTLLFGVALLCFGLYRKKRDWGWLGATMLFGYLSIDEGVALHEMAAEPVRNLLEIDGGLFTFAWTIPAILVALVLCAVFYRFFRRQPKSLQRYLGIGFGVMVVGAIGSELIAGAYWSAHNYTFTPTYAILNGIEETLELTGISLMLYGLYKTYTKR